MSLFLFILVFSENALISLDIQKETFEQVQLTLVLPSNLIAVQLPNRSKLIKTIYERLKIGGVFIPEVACMAAAGSNHGTGLVLNFDGEGGVEVAAVNDFTIVAPAVEYFNCNSVLKTSLLSNAFEYFDPTISSDSILKLSNGSSIPVSTVVTEFYKVYVSNLNSDGLNLLNVIESVLDRVDPDRRSITLNHIILNGILPLPYSLLVFCLQSILSSSPILSVSDYPADTQPSLFAFRSIPEFYFEIFESGRDDIAWFGATIAGKYAHADPKSFIPTCPVVVNSQQ